MEEFSEACQLISRHIEQPLTEADTIDMAKSMDINKDGYIDFNEFLECFRLVHTNANATVIREDDDEDEEEEEEDDGKYDVSNNIVSSDQ